MTRRRLLPVRSRAEWLVRAGLAAIVMLLGWVVFAQTLGYASRFGASDMAHRLAPHDGRIAALLSEKYSGPEAASSDRAAADQLARQALAHDATTVKAAATLGIDAAIRGDNAAARRLFTYSQKLSRRDLRTRLWALESAVAQGDIPGALLNYDIALRTSRTAPEVLFPVLSTAISDPDIRAGLIRTMARKPVWNDAFITYLDQKASDAGAKAQFFGGLQRGGVAVLPDVQSHTVDALIATDQIDEAWRYYAVVRPGVDRRRVRDPRFLSSIDFPSSFDWVPVNGTGISTSVQYDRTGGAFDFSVAPDVGGLLLRQLQLLPAGSYAIAGKSAGIDQQPASRPYWVLTCQDGRELGRVVLPNTVDNGGNFSGRFEVPQGCVRQTLSLVARPSDGVNGVSGQITAIHLQPVEHTR